MARLILDPAKIKDEAQAVESARFLVRETALQIACGFPANLPPAVASRLQLELAQLMRAASSSASELERLSKDLGVFSAGFRRSEVVDQLVSQDAYEGGPPAQQIEFWTDSLIARSAEAAQSGASSFSAFSDAFAEIDVPAPPVRDQTVAGDDPLAEQITAEFAKLSDIGAAGAGIENAATEGLRRLLASSGHRDVDLQIARESLVGQVATEDLRSFLVSDSNELISDDELARRTLEILAGAGDLVVLIAPNGDGSQSLIHTVLIDAGFAVFLTLNDGCWFASEPLSIDDLIWALIDVIGPNVGSTADIDTADSRVSSRVALRRACYRRRGGGSDGDPSAARSAEQLEFVGPPAAMKLVVESQEGPIERACSEEELYQLLAVALGPTIEPPKWPTDPGHRSVDELLRAPAGTAPPTSGSLGRIDIAACESASRKADSSGWQRAIANPEIVARVGLRADDSGVDDKLILSVSADSAVRWTTVEGSIDYEAFDNVGLSSQIELLLAEVTGSVQSPLPNQLIELLDTTTGESAVETLANALTEFEPGAIHDIERITLVLAAKQDSGVIWGEEIELLSVAGYGLFVSASDDADECRLLSTSRAELADRLVKRAFVSR